MKKSLIAALVFASASLAGSAAFAQTTTGGGTTTTGGGSTGSTSTVVGNTPQTITLTNGAGFFGDTFAANNMGATFSDKFNFNVANMGTGTGTSTAGTSLDAIISSISSGANTGLAVTGLSLYNTAGTVVAQGSMLQSGAVDVWTIHGANLTAGNYYLQVSGNLVGNTAAAFGGAISMAAPVPEPETYGMMLAGLGVLGFLARRRKAANQA